ncbi:MAG: type I glyceraldehyde-3-phosphate dehydrogenase [Nanoarchaeota archaeon]|nr:type I glyceraldehyde-3-phosphate dehydrogenase [Nanoarchaeota archaeon]MBU4086205.1 type I glyceraldehyde-3-phosphate dehydrogenase [Nanoarchaeota archaeon]
MVKIAINGFGRIGRSFFKIALERGMEVVAINDLTSPDVLAYLLKYDSVYGNYEKKVELGNGFLIVDRKKIQIFSEKDPINLPWKKLNVDIVIESTGFFTDREGASKHLKAGAKKVLISAPGKNPDVTIVPGVNLDKLTNGHNIISMASCTTNCLAPVAKVLNDNFKIKKAFMTTAHAYTNDQEILDVPHKKLRRGRAAAINIIPTSSGATTSVAEVIPELKGKMDGLALRVPVACGSIVDFVAELERKVSAEEVNKALKKAADGNLKGILQYTEDALVSSDVVGNSNSSVVDGLSTQAIGNLVKVLSWYDNEYGYSCRLADMIKLIGK